MITLSVNGETKTINANCSVNDALTQWGYQASTIAVAINQTFVPRSHYNEHHFIAGDCVDIVAPIQGG